MTDNQVKVLLAMAAIIIVAILAAAGLAIKFDGESATNFYSFLQTVVQFVATMAGAIGIIGHAASAYTAAHSPTPAPVMPGVVGPAMDASGTLAAVAGPPSTVGSPAAGAPPNGVTPDA